MKKALALSVAGYLALCVCLFLFCKDVRPRIERTYEFGTRKTETWYDADGRVIQHLAFYETELFERSMHAYDRDGKPTETRIYDEPGRLQTLVVYDYDDAGRLTRKTWYRRGCEDSRVEYAYDEFGRRAWCVEYLDDRLNSQMSCSYNDDGSRTDCTRLYTSDGDLCDVWVDEYDAAGERVSRDAYSFDESGNMTFRQFRDADDQLLFSEESVYDEDGNRTKWQKTEAGVVTARQENTYDADGNLIVQYIYGENDAFVSHTEYTYGEGGNLVGRLEFDEFGDCIRNDLPG